MRLHPAALSAVILSSMLRTKNAFVVVTTSLRPSSTSSSAFVTSKQSSIVSYRYKPTSFALSRQNFHLFSTNSKSNHDLEKESSSSSSSYDVQNAKNGITGSYNPAEFESSVYEWWEKNGCFDPDAVGKNLGVKSEQPAYVLPMPPPNVTGRLHMGHAIFVALQDVLARFHRMRGRPVLWLPGTDHAGIATQLQVEKQLAEEGKTRQEVGREEFLNRVWAYKEEQGGHITRQLRCLGASADWSRERFTMDADLSTSVTEAFVRLHEKGLIYRGTYMVNWAPLLQTAVSDLEVEYSEEEGRLYYFKYPVVGEDGKVDGDLHLPVATTRPETILGDTAVCVHPEDERYKHLIGRECMVPLSDRKIPIIADEYVDMEFGTGCLKITPGHDINDYELGKKHDLPIINLMNKDGTMNSNCGTYADLDRFDCREKLWGDMKEAGFVIKDEAHKQRVPRSQRGGEIIEPLVSPQWFCKTEGMSNKALNAVKDGDITILPKRFEKVWYNWLEDCHDWCVSRQLWWGHRIPVYYINETEDYVVARDIDHAKELAIEKGYNKDDLVLNQEEDVLDTWFSSGLWPFATLGWPNEENNDDLNRFYPSTCLETGYDILFFWVARMAMMGLELTGKSPFSVVYLHGLVRAADGSKMSKTKGNVVDPLDAVEKHGADALRYSLVTGVTPGQDVPLNMDKVTSNQQFANKLWNICKFVTDNALKDVDEGYKSELVSEKINSDTFNNLPLPEKYILSKLHKLISRVTEELESYNLGVGGSLVYEFIWDEFADWYVEVSKSRLYGGTEVEKKEARTVLVYVLDRCLKVLHPYMPHVTEQLWHHLPRKTYEGDDSVNALMLAEWPLMHNEDALIVSDEAEAQFDVFQSIIRSIRNARAEYNVDLGRKIPGAVLVAPEPMFTELNNELKSLVMLAKLDADDVRVVLSGDAEISNLAKNEEYIQLVASMGVEAYLPLSGLIDPVKERQRLERQQTKLAKEIEKLSARLNSSGFVDKAPEEVVEKARGELQELEDQMGKIAAGLEALV